MKPNKKLIKELIESGCSYDEAVKIAERGLRILAIKGKKDKRGKRKRSRRRTGMEK